MPAQQGDYEGLPLLHFEKIPRVFTVGILAIVLFATAIRFHKIDSFSSEYDEDAHVMVAWLMARGYDPCRRPQQCGGQRSANAGVSGLCRNSKDRWTPE
jgi:hypothetical protein